MMSFKKAPLLAVAMTLAVSLVSSPFHAGRSLAAPSEAEQPLVPVVLFSEPCDPGGDPSQHQASKERGAFHESGFSQYLLDNGYEIDETLFIFTPSETYEDLSSGAFAAKTFFEDIASRLSRNGRDGGGFQADPGRHRGRAQLDVVSYGVSGLVLRYALEKGYIQDGLIRNLIMLDSPNRGTFLAGFLKSFSEVAKHESIWEKETRASRFSPLGRISVPDGSVIQGEKDLLARSSNPFQISMKWESETNWISQRASAVYEPLYAAYVKNRYLSLPYTHIDSPQETFYGWIKRNFPNFWELWVESSNLPSPQHDLTLAYLETLAMDVARNQYVVKTASKSNLVDTVFAERYIPLNWKDAVRHYGLKILSHYAGKALTALKAHIQNQLAQKVVAETGFGKDPDSLLLRRLVNEEILLNLGHGAENRFQRVPVNHYLQNLNLNSMKKWGQRSTRYVFVSGRATNFWQLIWPQVGPNNWFCEVDSAVSPCGPLDLIRVFSGVLSPSHLTLLKDSRVRQFIKEILLSQEDSRKPWDTGGKMQVSTWRPSYITVTRSVKEPFGQSADREKCGGSAVVQFSLPQAKEGWSYCLWIEEMRGNQGDDQPLSIEWDICPDSLSYGKGGGMTWVSLKNPSVQRIGVRLVRTSPLGLSLGQRSVESCFEKEVFSWVMYAVTDSTPPCFGEIGQGMEDGKPDSWENISASPWEGPKGHSGQGDDPSDTAQEDDPKDSSQGHSSKSPVQGGADDDIPEITFVYRSKRTTHEKPFETYHAKWVIDYGDGHGEEILGNPVLEARHFYREPGSYQASIISYDNHGEVILEKRIKAEVKESQGENVDFRERSVPKLDVQADLLGPRMWITGKPALYEVKVSFQAPFWAQVKEVKIDPNEKFKVVWERAGDFIVSCAATLKVEYDLGEKRVSVRNTYLTEIPCKVLTQSMTR